MSDSYSPEVLKKFSPTKPFFIGIDSDGCAFDTMELKQKECFTPNVVKYFDLQSVSKYAREVCEFVNLYSKWRGQNRFIALIKDFELLESRPEVRQRNVALPDTSALKDWVSKETKLSTSSLREYVAGNPDSFLKQVLAWTEEVDRVVKDMVKGVGPFPYVAESLEKASKTADIIIVSATPCEALNREWEEHGLSSYPAVIAGQEMGSKSEHLQMASAPHYPAEKILMVGDAPGDLKAAESVGAMFYPIVPGAEEKSW